MKMAIEKHPFDKPGCPPSREKLLIRYCFHLILYSTWLSIRLSIGGLFLHVKGYYASKSRDWRGRGGTGFPPVIADPIGQTVADGIDEGLKTLKILPGL
jgi:hypothetical protein